MTVKVNNAPTAGDKYQAYLLCVRLRNELRAARLEQDWPRYREIKKMWLSAEIHYTAFR